MKKAFPELPEWSFEINELSAGVYEITATDKAGRRVQMKGTDYDGLLSDCRKGVAEMVAHQRGWATGAQTRVNDDSLIEIGVWYSEDEPELPHPRDFVGAGYDAAVRDRICAYLRSGREFMGWLGYSNCRFRCGIPDSEMGDLDLTDGVWVWPEGLAHYVEAHDVRLPDEFIEAMKANAWKVPEPGPDSYMGGAPAFSRDFWLRWAKTGARL